ncbi:hypothetical protein BGY98DRAFT_932471 [Russula aff. rugulosa BPL654]|nr:hypothetical protein BGY98DRAFT_932471 [Russula aff. rugulosa BPL654]
MSAGGSPLIIRCHSSHIQWSRCPGIIHTSTVTKWTSREQRKNYDKSSNYHTLSGLVCSKRRASFLPLRSWVLDISGILLILPITDFAVAAPVPAQEIPQAGVDVVHIREDAVTMSRKRGDSIDKFVLKEGHFKNPKFSLDPRPSSSSPAHALPKPAPLTEPSYESMKCFRHGFTRTCGLRIDGDSSIAAEIRTAEPVDGARLGPECFRHGFTRTMRLRIDGSAYIGAEAEIRTAEPVDGARLGPEVGGGGTAIAGRGVLETEFSLVRP